MDWYRCYHGAPTDPKWRVIAKELQCRTGEVAVIYWHLLDLASQGSERGVLFRDADQRIERIAEIAAVSDFDEGLVGGIIGAMEKRRVILDGRLPTWNERQPKREDGSSERAKAWRKRQQTQANAAERKRTQANARERREKERGDREKETIPPTTESTTARAREAARIVVDGFLAEREKHWPHDSRLPAPTMTLLTQAQRYLDDGAPLALCLDVFGRVMRQKIEGGERPPTDLGFCVRSMETEIGKLKRGRRSPPANGHAAVAPERGPIVWRGRLAMWVEKDAWFSTWDIDDCPSEVVAEFAERLRAKPPPGYRPQAPPPPS